MRLQVMKTSRIAELQLENTCSLENHKVFEQLYVYVQKYRNNRVCCCSVVIECPWSATMIMVGWSVNLTILTLGRLRPTKQLTST